jgi:hypothetical protein
MATAASSPSATCPRPNSGNARINIRLSGGGTIASDVNPPPQSPMVLRHRDRRRQREPAVLLLPQRRRRSLHRRREDRRGTNPRSRTQSPSQRRFRGSGPDQQLECDRGLRQFNRQHHTIVLLETAACGCAPRREDRAAAIPSSRATSPGSPRVRPTRSASGTRFHRRSRVLTARLSGSATVGLLRTDVPFGGLPGLKGLLNSFAQPSPDTGTFTARSLGGGSLSDLRAWYILNAIGSPRQLLEVLTQFLENHFVTEHAKSYDYFDRYYNDSTVEEAIATEWEYREITGWRNALLNPNCTFYDLLKVHAEKPGANRLSRHRGKPRRRHTRRQRELRPRTLRTLLHGRRQRLRSARHHRHVPRVDGLDRESGRPREHQQPLRAGHPNLRLSTRRPAAAGSPIAWASGPSATTPTGTAPTAPPSCRPGTSTPAAQTSCRSGLKPTRLVWEPPWAGRPYQIRLPRRTGSRGNSRRLRRHRQPLDQHLHCGISQHQTLPALHPRRVPESHHHCRPAGIRLLRLQRIRIAAPRPNSSASALSRGILRDRTGERATSAPSFAPSSAPNSSAATRVPCRRSRHRWNSP